MISHLRPACLALALAATAGPACAQTWVYERDNSAQVYQPRVVYQERYQERFVPRVYNSYAYEPVATAPAVALAPIQRTVVTRTIIPQGRGRGPIVKERIVSETSAPRVVTRPAAVDYAFRRPTVTEAYALAPAPAPRPLVVDYGRRVTDSYALAPLVQPVVAAPRPYRTINNRLLVVDPVTGDVVGEVND
jgi:hypothetical protein